MSTRFAFNKCDKFKSNALRVGRKLGMRTVAWLLAVGLLGACSHNPYLDASLTRYQGKDKSWIEKELGTPDARSSRFFGGEKWIYNRIAGGKAGPPIFNFKATECQMILFFDKDDIVSDSNYSGC